MPKIAAPTLAEHHARQRQALLEAAVEILETEGVAALVPGAVGRRAGLARSSVYQYFGSGAEIVAAVVEEAFPAANAALAAALDGVEDPLARLDTYVATTLRLGATGAHRVAAALSAAELPGPCLARLHQLHQEQAEPLRDAIAHLGVPDPELTSRLVGGVVQSALREVESGREVEATIVGVLDLIHAGVGAKSRS